MFRDQAAMSTLVLGWTLVTFSSSVTRKIVRSVIFHMTTHLSKPMKSLFVKLVNISKDRWQFFVIDMTEVEEDSDSVEEGEVWEEEGGFLVISTDKVDCLFVCLLLLLFFHKSWKVSSTSNKLLSFI